jgi:hypothetical protein
MTSNAVSRNDLKINFEVSRGMTSSWRGK